MQSALFVNNCLLKYNTKVIKLMKIYFDFCAIHRFFKIAKKYDKKYRQNLKNGVY